MLLVDGKKRKTTKLPEVEQMQHPGGNSQIGPRKFGSRERSFRKKERQFLMEVRTEGLLFRTEP